LNKRQKVTSDGAERQVSVVYIMTEQKKKLLKAKIAAALYHENGKVPSRQEIEKWTKFAKVLYTAVSSVRNRALITASATQSNCRGRWLPYFISEAIEEF
jgi:hypothetical protein